MKTEELLPKRELSIELWSQTRMGKQPTDYLQDVSVIFMDFNPCKRSENWCLYLLYLPQITLIKILHALYHTYCPSDASVFQEKKDFFCQPLVFIHFCTIWDNCWVLRHQYRMDTTGWITNWKNWTTALGPQTTIDTHSPKFTAWQFGNAINCKSVGLTGRIN